jgi:hypothetical protein
MWIVRVILICLWLAVVILLERSHVHILSLGLKFIQLLEKLLHNFYWVMRLHLGVVYPLVSNKVLNRSDEQGNGYMIRYLTVSLFYLFQSG